MPPLNLPVALRVIRRCSHMRHPADADELLEVLGNKLRPVVGDNPWFCVRIPFPGSLKDNLDIRFLHLSPDFPMNYGTATAIQDAAKVIERPDYVDIADVHMPMVMRPDRLLESQAFLRGITVPSLEQSIGG